ncbi:MAG: hypothetical protein HC830_07180 [Bacteroidetes bacterium]|nr:hypothetical protein [Bacteroidota bacterium]
MNPLFIRIFLPRMNRMYRPYTYGNNARNMDEIKTSEAVLVSFDAKGKVIWDYSMKLDEMKMPGIEQVSDFCIREDKVYFLYKKESELNRRRLFYRMKLPRNWQIKLRPQTHRMK